MGINSVFKERHNKIHLVGIGGIGMSGIARVLLESGFSVSGSDLNDSQDIKALRDRGATIFIGHDENNLVDADVLVFSGAISSNNPELKKAKEMNIPIISRAEMLAELMRLRCGIAISGAHGKTTTTSLIGTLMHKAGLDPTVVIGGIVNHFQSNAFLGQSQFMVTEADESDGSFLHLKPTIAVITNLDREHLDFYRSGMDEIKEKFYTFLNDLPFYGLAVLCYDDPYLKDMLSTINRRVITYGLEHGATYHAKNIKIDALKTSFDLYIKGKMIDRFSINMVGHHNVQNTLAAIAVLEELGISAESLRNYLPEFDGIKRRFSVIHQSHSFTVIDDYGHHPTEIKAVLKAARLSFPEKNIRVLFQPHRYSRTKDLLNEFSTCFFDCDSLVITEIYAASEAPLEGINAGFLAKHILGLKDGPYCTQDIKDGAQKIVERTGYGDIVIALGAGSVTKAAPEIVQLLNMKFGL